MGASDPEAEQIVLQHNHDAGSGRTPYYYQVNAINAAMEAMAKLSTHARTTEHDDGSRIDMTRAIDRKRRVDTAFEVFPGLYRAIAGPKAHRKTYRQFSRSSRAVG
ncbi:MAG: hypothetical protein OXQ89_22410 [Rhodospirillaceae bacterium]|nr:hypothetical protein [Rhodospirillaceae bacterium]